MSKDRNMTYKEFQIALIGLNLNIKDFARILGMNPNSITNYKLKGFVPLQLAIVINLMQELHNNQLNYLDVIEKTKRVFAENIIEN